MAGVKYQIVITIDEDGKSNVQGTINNKIVAYGLLAVARDAINEYHQKQEQRVKPASDADVAALIKPGN